MPSSAKNFAARKFEVVYRSEKHKTLRLECATVQERNDWYEALKRTITAAKVKYSEAWSRSEVLVIAKYSEYPDNLSDEDSKVVEPVDTSRGEDEDSSKVEPSELNDPYNTRYAVATSFKIQEFKEIDPMDDNVSQVSEQDVAFHQERRKCLAQDNITGSRCLSPFEKVGSKSTRGTTDEVIIMQSPDSNDLNNRSGSVVLVRKGASTEQNENKEDGFEFFDQGRKSSIVRRSGKQSPTPSTNSPQMYTIRLDGF